MRIGINLLFMRPGVVGGTETYSVALLDALGQIDARNHYVVFVNKEARNLQMPANPQFEKVVCPVPANYVPLRYLWEQLLLPLQVRRRGLDLLHSLGYVQPLWVGCKSVVTIHDLNFRNLRDHFSPLKRFGLGWFVTRSARRADHVLTVSEFSKAQIVRMLGIPDTKVTVTHNAVRQRPYELLPPLALQQRYGVRKPYILAFSSRSPHKNMSSLVQAFALVRERVCPECELVLVGHPPANESSLRTIIERKDLHDAVVFTGYVPDEVIPSLYAHAELLAFPSLYEGFGIPILEAFAYGVPVACSRVASLPEVGDDAACYFDPRDIEDMATVLGKILADERLREALAAKGRARVGEFSWEESARRTLAVYEAVQEP